MNPAAQAPAEDGRDVASAEQEQAWEHWRASRPRLRHSISLHDTAYRGQPWVILHDRLGQEQLRLDARSAALVRRMDGSRTLEVAARETGMQTGEDAEGLSSLLSLLNRLYDMGWITLQGHSDLDALRKRSERYHHLRGRSRWLRLMSPRFHLFDPARLLDRLQGTARVAFHPAGIVAWGLLTCVAILLAWMHWPDLAVYGAQRLDAPLGWVLLILLYPLVKALHELGHGLALRAAGGNVSSMGVTLLVFMPVPYVDARPATLLPDRRQRMLVASAGIMVESLLGALALFAWLASGEGLLRELSFAVMTLAGVSTLLFNGNPLLRYDGYYVLCDWLDIPNLATRSNGWYGYLAQRYWLRMSDEPAPHTAPGERRWLLLYAPLSLAYRIFISLAIAFLLINHVPSLGIGLAVWLLATQWGVPLWRQARRLLQTPATPATRWRPRVRLGMTLLLAGLLLAALPLPTSTRVEGIVLMPESSVLRIGADGFLLAQMARSGDKVQKGQPLLQLADPQLETDIAVMRAQVRELAGEKDALKLSDRLERDLAQQRLQEAQKDLEELLQRQARLRLLSPVDGVLRLSTHDRRDGIYLQQGELLGYVAQHRGASVRVVAREEDAARIRGGVESVSVRLVGAPDHPITGTLLADTPLAVEHLPSAALGDRGGGAIPVDGRDEKGLTTLEPVFTFDIRLAEPAAGRFIGRRAHVAFHHQATPLLPRLYAWARRTLLSEIRY